jgi:hypothetical protein
MFEESPAGHLRTNDRLLAVQLIYNGQLSERHLMHAKASVRPRIKIKEDSLTTRELRRAEDDATLAVHLTSLFFEDDSVGVHFTLE